ncbi:MAG: chemotaxis protein CheB [Nitrospirota bacterium]|nr:chemotaxis protein CheB [Nitrospirota bacterium]
MARQDLIVGVFHCRGVSTVAQDEARCVAVGMPKEAMRTGGVDMIFLLDDIPAAMLAYASCL